MQGFPLGTKIGKSPILDLCTEIVLFILAGSTLRLMLSQKALTVKEIMGFEDGSFIIQAKNSLKKTIL